MYRTRSYRREVRNKKIRKRKRICKVYHGTQWYKHDGCYSKGKIYCSCSKCRPGIRILRDRGLDVKEKYIYKITLKIKLIAISTH